MVDKITSSGSGLPPQPLDTPSVSRPSLRGLRKGDNPRNGPAASGKAPLAAPRSLPTDPLKTLKRVPGQPKIRRRKAAMPGPANKRWSNALSERRKIIGSKPTIDTKNTLFHNVKDAGGAVGYGAKAAGYGAEAVPDLGKQVKGQYNPAQHWDDKLVGKDLPQGQLLAAGMHDLAAPVGLAEYVASAAEISTDLGNNADAEREIMRDNALHILRRDAVTHFPTARMRKAALPALDRDIRLSRPRRIVADDTLAKSGHFQRLKHTRGVAGVLRYGAKTGFGIYHAVRGFMAVAKRGKFFDGVQAGIAASAKSSMLTAASIGLVFEPVSAVYYAKKAYDNSAKLGALKALQGRAETALDKVDDVELRAVAKRIQRKTVASHSANRFERVSHALKSVLSVVGTVGSVAAFLTAVGVNTAAVAGLAAALTAWPVILGVSAIAASITAACLLSKALRNRASRFEKEGLQEANLQAKMALEAIPKGVLGTTKVDADAPIYAKENHDTMLKVLNRTQDLDLARDLDPKSHKALVDRFEAHALTRDDLETIAAWTQNMLAARDTTVTIEMLMVRLAEDARRPDGDDNAKGDRIGTTQQLLEALGVPEEKRDAIRDAMTEIVKAQATGAKAEDVAASAAAIEKLLSEALLLR